MEAVGNPGAEPGGSSPAPRRDLLIALNLATGLPRATVCRLGAEADRWAHEVAEARLPALARQLGVPRPQLRSALALVPGASQAAAAEVRKAERLGAQLITLADADYPARLRDLALPPPVLYCRGDRFALATVPAVAVVGSRRADPYGLEAATFFAGSLAAAGLVIVSGFAHGVDAAAHRAALAAPAGRTVAVLGCGLGVAYPQGHGPLGQRVASAGAVVTEFPCGVRPRPWHFPVRNRIIAALSFGTLVVQATPRSGSLVTAQLALELGREIFAVPGRIFDERALGPHALVRDGATLVQHPRDVLDCLPETERVRLAAALPAPALLEEAPLPAPGDLPGRLLRLLQRGDPKGPEQIAGLAGAEVEAVLGALLELELQGRVRRHPGPLYCRCG